MVDLRHLPPDENPERRLDNIEEEETRGQRSLESRAVDLKQKSLQALAQSLESRGVSTLPPGPSLDEGKHGGAFAKPKEALLLALSDLQCNDWEVNLGQVFIPACYLSAILHIDMTTHCQAVVEALEAVARLATWHPGLLLPRLDFG